MSFTLKVFADFICPFCYIGSATVRKLQPEFGFAIEPHSFQIHPEWPPEGLELARHPRMMDPKARQMIWNHIGELADAAGLEMKPPAILANSRLALQTAMFAREKGCGERFDQRVYQAYFKEGLNIGMRGVLLDLAIDVGLERAETEGALDSEDYAYQMGQETMLARQLGVTGVPAFFLGPYSFGGAQSEEVIREIFRRYGAEAAAAR
ncbi:MAG TPA: DsbA family oxidoreductase [Candidatus Binataceae bacterium]|nr:DsbA family oxidoreductase [Candidatus Binataceae bacterium]